MPRESESLDALKKYRKSGFEQFIKYVREIPLHSPKTIFKRLEEGGYRGQNEARQAISLMAYRHVRRIKRIYLDGVKREQIMPKSNYLFMGPTGSGKTFLVELLFQQILRLPTAIVDITTYSETGYVGQDPSTILTRLLHAADENPLLAAIGIVCLDEFDKIASGQNNAVFAGAGTTKDVTGMGVQRELLKMLESGEVVVPLELTHASYGDHIVLSTADISFVACGAFAGFQKLAQERDALNRIGFGRSGKKKAASTGSGIAVTLANSEVESVANFQAYGFLPELMARFTRFVPFQALDADTLKDILRISVVEKFTREFEEEGFRLRVSEEAMDYLVGESLRRETGARGLSSILTQKLESVAFDTFAEHPGADIVVKVVGGNLVAAVQP